MCLGRRKKEPKASFSIGFRSYVRHFRGAILGLLRPSEAWCFPARRWFFPWCFPIRGPAAAVLSVSEVTLGIFGVQFSGFSVLQRQGVSLPGGDFFHGVFPSEDQQQQQQKPLQQQEEKVAKIHSSSKRKKQPKSSFSMGFRSYVRHFRGAILGLLRPSEAWCFPAGRWFFPWCFPIWGPDVKVAKIHSSSKRKKRSQNHHFLWQINILSNILHSKIWNIPYENIHINKGGPESAKHWRIFRSLLVCLIADSSGVGGRGGSPYTIYIYKY